MGDDSIGLRLIEAIADRRLDVEAGFGMAEIGHDGLRLVTFFREDVQKIVIVDCVRMGREAGDVAVFSPEEVVSKKQVGGYSTHESDILKTIELARGLGYPIPPITIMGIEPLMMEPSMELSPLLKGRFEEYLQRAVNLAR